MLHFAKKFKVTTKMLVLAEIRSMRCKRLTFGRWVEGKVYGHNESVRPRVSENGQVSDIGHF